MSQEQKVKELSIQELTKGYEKFYAIDTNIVLDNVFNLERLSENSKNLIVVPSIVLDEIDTKKSGFDEINFQARNFARLLRESKIEGKAKDKELSIIKTSYGTDSNKTTILIIDKVNFKVQNEDRKILNDRKILELVQDFNSTIYCTFLSLDIMARTRALSLGINTESLALSSDNFKVEIDFHEELLVPEDINNDTKSFVKFIEDNVKESTCSVQLDKDNKKYFFYKDLNWTELSDKNLKRYPVPPLDTRQKVMSELITGYSDIVVVEGQAGTGKNAIALSAATRLIDTNPNYEKIYYIRRTVISGDTEDEIGFLPGDKTEKTRDYNQPMEDSIKTLLKLKHKSITKEELPDKIEKFKEKYDIEYLYSGHLRGSNFDPGSIVIIDETQNFTVTGLRTIVSRIGKNSKAIIIGSNNQIDSKYLTPNNNALTFMINKVLKENNNNIEVRGVKLTNVIRSKHAEYADEEIVQK